MPGSDRSACQQTRASTNVKVSRANTLCLQVWQIMPKDKLEFLQAELSFFDEVTQVSQGCRLLYSQVFCQLAPSMADLLQCRPDRALPGDLRRQGSLETLWLKTD